MTLHNTQYQLAEHIVIFSDFIWYLIFLILKKEQFNCQICELFCILYVHAFSHAILNRFVFA